MKVIPFRKKIPNEENGSSTQFDFETTRHWQAIGIDLGTTHSVLSIIDEHMEHPRALEFGSSALVPSVLRWNPEKEIVEVGSWDLDDPEIIRSTKRRLGEADSDFQSNGKFFAAEAVACEVLKKLSSHPEAVEAKNKMGDLWTVITVPAHFGDAARQSTVKAATEAGLKVLRIINEPTAAALAYSMLPDVVHTPHELLAVFDFGGGTFDVTLVERKGLTFQVLSSEGDLKLGGDDVNHLVALQLAKMIAPGKYADSPDFLKTHLYHVLVVEAERAKKVLQQNMTHHISVEESYPLGNFNLSFDLQRETLEEWIAPLIGRTLSLTDRAILAARKRNKDVTRVLLVGGSTRLLLVSRMLQAHYPLAKVDGRLEPDLAVSWGASLQASLLLGIKLDTILVDVCSHSLGIGVAEDGKTLQSNFKEACKHFGLLPSIPEHKVSSVLGERAPEFQAYLQGLLRVAPIIPRNSPLPSKKSEFFSTLYDEQEAVQVLVVQGEGEHIRDNKVIGSFLFHLKSPAPAGTKCEIQLTYDANGMIQVMAKQHGTNHQALAQFNSATGEVTNWVEVETVDSSPGTSETTEFEVKPHPTGVAPATRAWTPSFAPPQDPDSSETPELQAPFANALMRKMDALLLRKGLSSSEVLEWRGIRMRYQSLMARSLQGEHVDQELEDFEAEIEQRLKEKSP